MSRTQYYAAASLDGYIAEDDDTLDWLTKYQGSYEGDDANPMKGDYDRFYDGVGALVMGSVTYEWVLEHLESWPYSGKPTWVLSARELPQPPGDGAEVHVAASDVPAIHADMLASAGERNLWVVGGGNVASQFAGAVLLDELIVTVVPVVLGSGKPLFDERLPGGPMQLVGARPFDSGMVELRYDLER
jgi:dihydrofolate reductase